MSIAAIKKDGKPIILTGVLFLTAIAFLYLPIASKETSLWVDVIVFAMLNAGFLVAAILGGKTKNTSVVWFSVLVNSAFIVIGMMFIVVYLSILLVPEIG